MFNDMTIFLTDFPPDERDIQLQSDSDSLPELDNPREIQNHVISQPKMNTWNRLTEIVILMMWYFILFGLSHVILNYLSQHGFSPKVQSFTVSTKTYHSVSIRSTS